MSGYSSRNVEDGADVSALANELRQSRIDPEFTTQAVRNETGIPSDTLYAWERRHQFPLPSRTDTGQRRYSERDIVAISWLREQTSQGHSISDALALLRRALEVLPGREAPVAPPLVASTPLETFVQALQTGELARAQAAWDEIALATSPDALLDDVILSAWMKINGGETGTPAREQALEFLFRKVVVLLDSAGPESGDRDAAVLINGPSDVTIPAYALACSLARTGYRIALPALDASRATTLGSVARLQAGAVIIVVSPEPEKDLLDSYRVVNPDARCFRWWPAEAHAEGDTDRLPPSLRQVAAALDDHA